MESKNEEEISGFLNTSNLVPGKYNVIVNIDYGKNITINDSFRVGTLYVNITDYSYLFKPFKINKFWIEIENLWNSELDRVYAKVIVTQNGTVVDTFKTPSIKLDPWQKTNLTGFFDAEKLGEGKYKANMVIHYGEKTNYKLVMITLIKDSGINYYLIISIIAGIIFLIFIIILIIYLIRKIKQLKLKIKRNGKKTK
jgi:hypothetical protein